MTEASTPFFATLLLEHLTLIELYTRSVGFIIFNGLLAQRSTLGEDGIAPLHHFLDAKIKRFDYSFAGLATADLVRF